MNGVLRPRWNKYLSFLEFAEFPTLARSNDYLHGLAQQ